MAGDLKLSFIVELMDKMSGPARMMEENVKHFSRGVMGEFKGAFDQVERFGNSVAGIGSSIGAGIELGELISDEDFFNRLGVQAGMTKGAVDELRGSMLASARAIGISSSESVAALKGYKEMTGGVAGFKANIDTVSAAIQILGGQGADIGTALGDLEKHFGIKTPAAIARTMAALLQQSKGVPGGFSGMVTALTLDAEGFTSNLGLKGEKGATQFGALFAAIESGKGRARGALEVMRDLQEAMFSRDAYENQPYMHLIQAGHLDPRASHSLPEIIKGIQAEYAKRPGWVKSVLGNDLGRDIAAINSKVLNQKLGVVGDPAKLTRDAGAASTSLTSELNRLHDSLKQFEDDKLLEPIRLLSRFLGEHPDAAAWTFWGVAVVSALSVMAPGLRFAIWLIGLLGEAEWLAVRGIIALGGAALAATEGVGALAGIIFGPLGLLAAVVGLAAAFEHFSTEKFEEQLNKITDPAKARMWTDALKAILGPFDFTIPQALPEDPKTQGMSWWQKLRYHNPWLPDLGGSSVTPQMPDIVPGGAFHPAAYTVSGSGDAHAPRGIRNNNPLNLSYRADQPGVVGSDGRFGRYATMADGVAAAERQLLRYQDRGLDTLTKMISRWAPPSENDTAGYIANVSKRSGIAANRSIDMRNPAIATAVIAAMAKQETGRDVDRDSISGGVAQALASRSRHEVAITVNAPRGTRAAVTRAEGKADLDLSMGYSVVTP